VTKPRKPDGIYRANENGRSTHIRERRESIAAELLARSIRIEPGKADLIKTRQSVELGWRAVSDALRGEGKPDIAAAVDRFLKEIPPPQSEREWMAAEMLGHMPPPPVQERPIAR
jgi:hypothetical protein